MIYLKPETQLLNIILLISLIITVMARPSQAQKNGEASVTIEGQVLDEEDEPLHLAHLKIEGTSNGDVTNPNGQFQLEVPPSDSAVVVVSMVGYASAKKKVELKSGQSVELDFQLGPQQATLEETTITADAFTTGDAEGVTLSPTEVVTTPGASADIFRALQTFPGVSSINEGSGLFVRGGDVSEVSFILDQAPVMQPYKYERPTGGIFGTIPPFLVSGTHFSTGGFSAKYGNAMSGVLDMQSEGMPSTTQFDANIGMAALSAGGSVPIVPGKLGVRFSGNRSLTSFMFDLNGLQEEFEQTPMGGDGNMSIIAKPYKGTTIKFFNYANHNRLGVRVPQPSFDASYHSDEQNRLHNLQWKQLWGDWLLKTSISLNRYETDRELGGLDLSEESRTHKFRSGVEFSGFEKSTWYAGIEGGKYGNKYNGSVPAREDIVDPSANFQPVDERYATKRFGGYIERTNQILPTLELRSGLRADYDNISDQWSFDRRISLEFKPNNNSKFRLARGLYHQYAEPYEYNAETGNPNLEPQQAWHHIAGYEFKKDLFHIRTEAYHKSYDDLIIEDEEQNLSNEGYGEAYGADFFFKYSDFMRTPFNGWISYSLLRSKRLQPRQKSGNLDYEYAPSAFDITHNLNVVAKSRLINMLTGGFTYRFSTGRPFTPVIDAEQTAEDFYLPVEGSVHSKRLPHFHRLDLNLSYYWVPKQNWSVIFYTSVSNVLDRQNVIDYTYNKDYSQRSSVNSDYSRFIYAGVTLNLEL